MDNSIPITVLMLLTTILVPIVGIMLALTPYLMKKSECFAVTVPESALHDPYLRALKKRYALLVLLATAVLTALGLGFTYGANERAVIVLVSVGMLL
ncbi:MAG: hypothetical protein LBB46_03040, partial [Coriobacteriaceae bacterium]|nr:hypothetical protein [Coriobacteriaceae bacterium]